MEKIHVKTSKAILEEIHKDISEAIHVKFSLIFFFGKFWITSAVSKDTRRGFKKKFFRIFINDLQV